MLPFFTERFANPASSTHKEGRSSQQAVSFARSQVAELINAARDEIVFTSTATESNNIAILGTSDNAAANRRTVITSAIEHKSVSEPVRSLSRRGFRPTTVDVDNYGRVKIGELEAMLAQHSPYLVSIQAANSEIGTIQPIREIAEMAHFYGALVHCDAVQAVGRIEVDVEEWEVDFLAFSAHKLYGPKGIAALYVRGGSKSPRISPVMFGGGHEGGLRPGTLNVPGIVGFGAAAQIAREVLPSEMLRLSQLRDQFELSMLEVHSTIQRNGFLLDRLPGNSNLTFSVDAEALMMRLPHFALSTGSACSAGTLEPSPVLQAIGRSREEAYMTLRIGLGRYTTENEIHSLTTGLNREIALISAIQ